MHNYSVDDVISMYNESVRFSKVDLFRQRVERSFVCSPILNRGIPPVIHSVKSRMKDSDHLREKLIRKHDQYMFQESPEACLKKITDLAGVRVLHLYLEQFEYINQYINEQIIEKEWFIAEPPKAYTWDIDTQKYFSLLGLNCEVRESYYTSVHYVVSPAPDSWISCEIQVRTLFEEIWGEIDHSINYPRSTDSVACKEQLRVLSKLASTGTRLASSIFKSIEEFKSISDNMLIAQKDIT